MWSVLEEDASLVKRGIHQPDLPLRKISYAPMNQFRTPAGCPFGKISLFQQQHPVSPVGSVHSDSQTGRTTANNDQIPFLHAAQLVKLVGTIKAVRLAHEFRIISYSFDFKNKESELK
jgi:hypothetical protein